MTFELEHEGRAANPRPSTPGDGSAEPGQPLAPLEGGLRAQLSVYWKRGLGGFALFGFLISAVAVAGVVLWALEQPAPELPSGADGIGLLLAAVGVYAAGTVLRSCRWRDLLRAAGPAPGRGDAAGLVAVGFMGNNILPLRGGDGIRAFYGARISGGKIREAIGSLLAERLLDVVVLLGLYAFVAYGLLRGIDLPSTIDPLLVVIAAPVAAAAGIASVAALRRTSRGRRAADAVTPVLRATQRLRGAHLAKMAALTLSIWLLEGTVYLLCARALDIDIDTLEAVYILGVTGVSVMVPAGPGYAGTFDAGVLFGASAVGIESQLALSYLLVLRLVIFLPITAFGLALLLGRYGRMRNWTDGREARG